MSADASDRDHCNRLLAALGGRAMTQFTVGGGVKLHLHGAPWHVVTIETEFRHSSTDGTWSGQPVTIAALERLLPLLMREVLAVSIDEGGSLTMDFGEARIVVPVDENYEAWQVSADDGFLIVSMPGGQLAYWTPSPSA